jgi:hypothetical protein
MTPLYELALLGVPSPKQATDLESEIVRLLHPFALALGKEVSWQITPAKFAPSQHHASAAIFFGGAGTTDAGLEQILEQGVPVIPVCSRKVKFAAEIPGRLRAFNGMEYEADGPLRIATALLECAGLLPHQRRVFVSYRRDESREAALQLFDEFSRRLFDVFLDAHGIPPAEDFQALLWHRLCDSDVLVMIDTPTYFDKRWTKAEFGRALAKKIRVLRIGWPGTSRSPRTATADAIDLASADIDASTGRLSGSAIDRICYQLEASRSESIAVRHLNLVGLLKLGVEQIGGSVEGVGLHKGIHIRLPDDRTLVAYPTIGSPTSHTLHRAVISSPMTAPAIVYDPVGLHADHLTHLDWLAQKIPGIGLVRAHEISWRFADWE